MTYRFIRDCDAVERFFLAIVTVSCCVFPSSLVAQVFANEQNLSALNGVNGIALNGINENDESGFSVSGAGDVNNDGIDDVIIGARLANDTSGESYIVFGSQETRLGGVFDLSSLDGVNGFVIKGIDLNDMSGYSVSDAGDINADGVADVIIGAPFADPQGREDAGEIYLIYGGVSVATNGILNLSELDENQGLLVNGVKSGDNSGHSVSALGDINSDGINDVLIGAWHADPDNKPGAGKSYVIFGNELLGKDGSLNLSELDGSNGFVINGIDTNDFSGYSVSEAGDVNKDGVNDLIIGARDADPNDKLGAGEAYIVFGEKSIGHQGELNLSELNGSNGFMIQGVTFSDLLGVSVSSAGDFNGDDIDDVIVGASLGGSNGKFGSGDSYIVLGSEKIGESGRLDLSDLKVGEGVVVNGINVLDSAGFSVSDIEDFNGDGIDDVVIGAHSAGRISNVNAGESYILFGSSEISAVLTLELSSLKGKKGFSINGVKAEDQSGYSVSGIGDFNSDGLSDLIIGAHFSDPENRTNAGVSYIIYGAVGHAICNGKPVTVNLALGQQPTDADDVILGTEQADNIKALAGNDTICSFGGHDVIHAGIGDDWVDAGDGDDKILGLEGADTLNGGAGIDEIIAGMGNDRVFGGEGNDTLNGGGGNDEIDGGSGADKIYGQIGDDKLLGGAGDDSLLGSDGVDEIDGGPGKDLINGGHGDDHCVFEASDTVFNCS